MASRENTGLQIALILFVIIAVALGATVYFLFDAKRDVAKELKDQKQTVTSLQTQVGQLGDENKALKEMIGGYPPDTPIRTIQADFEKDMEEYLANQAPALRNYRNVGYFLIQAHHKLHEETLAFAENEKRWKAEIATIQKKLEEVAKDKMAVQTAADQKVAAFRGEWKDKRNNLDNLVSNAQGELGKVKSQYDTLVRSKDSNEKTLLARVSDLQNKIDTFTAQIRRLESAQATTSTGSRSGIVSPGTVMKPDGQIAWVNARDQTVWINRGRMHGLRPQVTFSVYDRDATTASAAQKKGSIEVIKVEDSTALARVVEDTARNPIVKYDKIYSPVWDANRRLQVAMAGKMDIDGDGDSDRAYVKRKAIVGGAEVVAEVTDDGKRTGTINVNTKYLVLGLPPTERDSKALQNEYSRIVQQAETSGVQTISVNNFLDLMGAASGERTVNLGRGSDSSDFRAEPTRGVNPESTGNNSFRRRSPPAGGARGAYP